MRVRVRHREVHSDVTVCVAVDVFLQEREGGRREGWREDGRERVSSVCVWRTYGEAHEADQYAADNHADRQHAAQPDCAHPPRTMLVTFITLNNTRHLHYHIAITRRTAHTHHISSNDCQRFCFSLRCLTNSSKMVLTFM